MEVFRNIRHTSFNYKTDLRQDRERRSETCKAEPRCHPENFEYKIKRVLRTSTEAPGSTMSRP